MARHMKAEFYSIADRIAFSLFGRTQTEARAKGICISCGMKAPHKDKVSDLCVKCSEDAARRNLENGTQMVCTGGTYGNA